MGQATADLPDPLEPVTAPAAPAAADDLLAQLAGDEIDRLLAEAEVEQEKGSASTSGSSRQADADFDWALRRSAETDSSTPAADSAQNLPVLSSTAALAQATLNQQMQQVFAGFTPVEAPADEASAGPSRLIEARVIDTQLAPVPPALPAETSAQPVVAAPADAGTSLAERDGLRAGEIDALSADAIDAAQPEPTVPLLLRPLVWINAPFAAVPEDARAALGKVAIVTLVNAIGVLAYVLIFRR